MKFGLNIKSLGAAVLIMGLQPTVAHAQGLQGSTKLSSVNVDLVSSVLTKVKKSVVKVKSNDEFTCMGTVIESDGYILTSFRMVEFQRRKLLPRMKSSTWLC